LKGRLHAAGLRSRRCGRRKRHPKRFRDAAPFLMVHPAASCLLTSV
jgi:hypothetical protein